MSNSYNIATWVAKADLLVGAVLIPGAKAPKLVSEEMVKSMSAGSVIVDVAIDQGGSVATIDRITTHSEPTYIKHGVVHYAVANMPGAGVCKIVCASVLSHRESSKMGKRGRGSKWQIKIVSDSSVRNSFGA